MKSKAVSNISPTSRDMTAAPKIFERVQPAIFAQNIEILHSISSHFGSR
jgi:hypothetical protein